MVDKDDNKYYAWCDDCHHYPYEHRKGKGKCMGHDSFGACPCKKFVPSKELLNQ